LHGVEFVGGAGDAAETRDRGKSHEIGQFHGVSSVSIARWRRSLVFIFRE
jgi:hypothetical protein